MVKLVKMDSLIIFGAKYLFVTLPLIFCVAWFQASRKNKVNMALAIILAGIAAGILDKAFSKLYYDPRPFVGHHVTPLIKHAADNGFPSEHTLLTFTIAAVLFFYRPKLSYAAGILAAIVGISRVAAHVHSPIDIIGGALMGIIAGTTGYFLADAYLSRRLRRTDKKT